MNLKKTPKMSVLEFLPQNVRRKIFQYLLSSDLVREPPNHLLVEHYTPQVNVLQLNRNINAEASAILYGENTFIKVDWVFEQCYESMLNHEVPFFKLSEKSMFDHQIADIKITFHESRKFFSAAKTQKFLILLHDIPKLARLLRILDVANFMGFIFAIKLQKSLLASTSPDLTVQKELLLPFEKVRGTAFVQEVSITGPVDDSLAQRVKQAMTQKIAWLRGGTWEIYDIVVSIKRMGDLAFSLGNSDMTCAKYIDALNFDENAMKTNTMMKALENQPYHQAMARLHYTIYVDMSLLAVSEITEKEEGSRLYSMVPKNTRYIEEAENLNKKVGEDVFPSSFIARFYHILGVAELGLNHPIKAAKGFVKAYSIVRTSDTKLGWEIASVWKDLAVTERKARLSELLTTLPTTPLPVPDMKPYYTTEVESEIWVMRQLGLKGDIPYADKISPSIAIIATNKPHRNHHGPGPRTARVGMLKPEALIKHVKKFRKQMNHSAAKGKLICWVALDADDIGEESILDDPGMANMIRNMSQRMAGLWPFGGGQS